MARRSGSAPPSGEKLLQATKPRSAAKLGTSQHSITETHGANGKQAEEEAALVQATKTSLPAPEMRRLKRLIGKSERGTLTPKDLAEYQALAQRVQQIDVIRVGALAELMRRRGKPLEVVKQEVGWQGGGMDGA